MSEKLTRRDFVAASATAVAVASSAEAKLPQRDLGRTGARVPLLGLGTAPIGNRLELNGAVAFFNECIDAGVTYLDTAPEFAGYGKAQEYLGHVMKERRNEVFLVTKCWEPKAEDALRLLEKNLKELQTDHADLVYAHSLGDDKMVPAVVAGKGGVFEMLRKAKQEGLTRFVGMSGHNRPQRFVEHLNAFAAEVMMNAVNFADRYTYNFENVVWPVAAQKGVALVAMKALGGANSKQGGLSNRMMPESDIELAIRYALGLPHLACAVIGMATRDELRRNLELVKSYQPLTPAELATLDQRGRALAQEWKDHLGATV